MRTETRQESAVMGKGEELTREGACGARDTERGGSLTTKKEGDSGESRGP